MKLKTLKEVKLTTQPIYKFKSILRKELAIPWIKELRRGGRECIPYIAGIHIEFNDEYYIEETIIDCLKEIFNLTEDDLK